MFHLICAIIFIIKQLIVCVMTSNDVKTAKLLSGLTLFPFC